VAKKKRRIARPATKSKRPKPKKVEKKPRVYRDARGRFVSKSPKKKPAVKKPVSRGKPVVVKRVKKKTRPEARPAPKPKAKPKKRPLSPPVKRPKKRKKRHLSERIGAAFGHFNIPVPLPVPETVLGPLTLRQQIEEWKNVPAGDLSPIQLDLFLGFTKKDGTLAKHYSSMRHLVEADSLREKIDRARRKGEHILEDYVNELADDFQVSTREVYSLFYSP
jgi:hypothetical protein